MRRGSVFTYAEEGRRNSARMAQLDLPRNRSEFAVDHIEYNREGGFFVSHKKIGICVLIALICVIGAGFIGVYIASFSEKKVHDSLALLEEGKVKLEESTEKYTLSPFVYPLRYHISLTPIFVNETISKIHGRIAIEFRQNDTKSLDKLILNAKNINTFKYRLISINKETGTSVISRKRRVPPENDNSTTVLSEEDDIMNLTSTYVPTTGTLDEAVGRIFSSSDDIDTSNLENITEDAIENETFSKKVKEVNASLPSESNDAPQESEEKNTLEKKGEGPELDESSTFDLSNETRKDTGISNYEIDELGEVHVIQPSSPMEQGNYFLEIEYEVPFSNNSAIFVSNFTANGESRWLMATQLKPTNSRRLFPAFDDMKFKARFSLSVARPREMKVLSNTPLKTTNDSSGDQVVDIFEESELLSPHNLAFLESNVQFIAKTVYGEPKIQINFWGDSERKLQMAYFMDKTDAVLENFISLFNITYPMKKMDVIGLPMVVDGNGSPGLILIKEQLFYVDDKSSMVTKINAIKNLIHRTGEQWLGGLINTQSWTDAWLLEGSLIYFSHALLKEIDTAFNTSGSFESDVQWKTMDRDGYSVSRSLQSKIHASQLHAFDPQDHYNKGACLIRMLHGLIGETAFRSGYQKFLSRWTYGNGNLESFWEAVEEKLSENLKLSDVMSSWITQNGYPVIFVNRNYESGSATIKQVWFTYDNISTSTEKLWKIPLTYVEKNYSNWTFPTKIWMKSEPEISVKNIADKNSWVLFNINKTGYYRVNYDNANWKLLSEALKENHKQFPPETRASLIDDVLNLAQGGFVSYELALNFVNYMKTKERDYAPWVAVTTHLLKLKFALYETIVYQDFQIFVRNFVSTIYNESELRTEEGSQLDLLIKEVSCTFEHNQCLDWARKEFEMIKASENSLPIHTRELIYCTIARVGGKDDWQHLLEKAITASDKEEKKRLLSSLSCFQVSSILQKLLEMTVEENSFNKEESRIILQSFSKNPEGAFAVVRFMERNFPEVIRRYGKSHSMMKAFISAMSKSLKTEQDLVEFQVFRENNFESLKIVGYEVVLAEVESNAWTKWRNNSLSTIKNWINNYNKSPQ